MHIIVQPFHNKKKTASYEWFCVCVLTGIKASGIQPRIVMSIVAVRFIILPVLGIFIVRGVVDLGLVPSDDKLLVFILLLQYSLPPAMNIGM